MAEFNPDQKSVKLCGKIKYARGLQTAKLFDTDEPPKWTCVLYPDADSVDTIRNMQDNGLMNKLKKDDDGYHITLSRPEWKVYKGVRKEFSPPYCRMRDGAGVAPNNVGNGSDVEATLETYKWKQRGGQRFNVAMRLNGIDIKELVEFIPEKQEANSEETF